MQIIFKPGGGGQPQPYLPKENGPKSGQYISFASLSSFGVNPNKFIRVLSKKEIVKKISMLQLKILQTYTMPNFAKTLN